jgi:hypothetical protein
MKNQDRNAIAEHIVWNSFLRILVVVIIIFTPSHYTQILQPFDCIEPEGTA